MSSITCSSASPLEWTTSANSRCSPVRSVPSNRSVMPITAFIGVRISWLIVARKALLACVAALTSELIRHDELVDRAADRFVSGVAEKRRGGRVPAGHSLVGIHDDDR